MLSAESAQSTQDKGRVPNKMTQAGEMVQCIHCMLCKNKDMHF